MGSKPGAYYDPFGLRRWRWYDGWLETGLPLIRDKQTRRAARDGWRDGKVIVANELTFGLILEDEVDAIGDEYCDSFFFEGSRVAGGVARDSLIAASGVGAASLAGRSVGAVRTLATGYAGLVGGYELYQSGESFVYSYRALANGEYAIAALHFVGGGVGLLGAGGTAGELIQGVGRGTGKAAARSARAAEEAFHYTQSKYVDSILETGLRRGSFATTEGTLSPIQAHIELSLPPNTPLRDAIIGIDLDALRRAGFDVPNPTRVTHIVERGGRIYTMPGGGWEMQLPYLIRPEFLRRIR